MLVLLVLGLWLGLDVALVGLGLLALRVSRRVVQLLVATRAWPH